ncbi:MAG TPA: hypothetical protein VFS16_08440, partial [Acidimicrobiia bacterium]|nr:hypothetical protein [Acidimicrobiia bacterium]
MTTLAPLPGRDADPDGTGAGSPGDEVVVAEGVAVESPARMTPATLDLTVPRTRPTAGNPAAQASWVFGLALSLLSEGTAERVVMAEVLAEAAGRSRALEGAYGRGVALLSEYPGDPL